ncbi:MAG: sulfotransferase [Alphaproteobacteria bacterium]|nr:sulfotransferase [Alphaproteobacteria bacterium]
MPKMPVPPKNPPVFGQVQPSPFAEARFGQANHPNKAARPAGVARDRLLMLLQQGLGLQRDGKFLEAERFYQMVLQQAPEMPEANNLMGTIAMEAEDFSTAVEYLEKAVAGLPRDPLIRHNIGSALMSLNDLHAAIGHFRKALEIKPGQVETLGLMATCYNRMGRSSDALPLAEKALRMDEGNVTARMAKADGLINLGRMDEAVIYLKQSIAAGIAVPRAFQSLAAARKFSADSEELAAVKLALSGDGFSEEEKSSLHYAAAKMSNDAKLFDAAMEHYLAAKAVSAKAYDIGSYERRIDSFSNFFNPLFFGARQNHGDPSQKPVFIVGMPRSGTTLTEQIISSHHDVAGAGELAEMTAIARSLGDNPRSQDRYLARLSALSVEESRALAQRYLKFIARTSLDAARITDKMPHNFEHVGLISLLFPNATIIYCRRDAIDNCLSCYMNAFSEAHAYNTDLAKLGRYYRAHDRLMKHWQKVLPGRILENVYEKLVDDQEGQSRKLIAHCNLEWDPACLNYTENDRSVTTISRWQVRQPIYKTSMKRWKPYEKYLGPLIAALGDLADTE